MKKTVILSLITTLFFTVLPGAQAQQKDFQFWPSAGVSLDLPNKFKAMVEEEVRLKENSTQMERQINNIGIGYRVNKFVRTAVYYRVVAKQEHPGLYVWRQGLYADISLKYVSGPFQFDYRVRFQSARVEFNRINDLVDNHFINRHKAGCTYGLVNLPVDVSAEGELFFKTGDGYLLSEYRLWAGIAWKPGKQHEFGLKCGIDREIHVKDPLTAYVIAFDYTFNIKL